MPVLSRNFELYFEQMLKRTSCSKVVAALAWKLSEGDSWVRAKQNGVELLLVTVDGAGPSRAAADAQWGQKKHLAVLNH